MPDGQRITPQHYRRICRILEIYGFQYIGQEGSHIKYRKAQKEGRTLIVTVPRYKCLVKNTLNY